MSYVQKSKSRTSVKNDEERPEQINPSPLTIATASGMGGAATFALISSGAKLYKKYQKKKKRKNILPKTLIQKISFHIGKISHFGTKLHGFNRAFKAPISMATNIAICASIYAFIKKKIAIYIKNRSTTIS